MKQWEKNRINRRIYVIEPSLQQAHPLEEIPIETKKFIPQSEGLSYLIGKWP